MAFTMHDPAALRRYIGRTNELLGITPGARARALLQQMIRDAERQLSKRSQTEANAQHGETDEVDEVPPLPLGGSAIALHSMSAAQLDSGIRDASELAAQLMDTHPDAAQLLLSGIELAISELVVRSANGTTSEPLQN
jgi:hypothetical protein